MAETGASARIAKLRRVLERDPAPGPAFPCSYLPGRQARHQTLLASPCPPGLYRVLMDMNFRRLGDLVYRPRCDGCAECRQIRVPVQGFLPSRAQRRCRARNADVVATVGPPELTGEKVDLYRRYLQARHDGQMSGSEEELERFLYVSSVDTIEVCYRAEGRLLGVGIADVEPGALSAVYSFFEPEEPGRSLGVLNVLSLIDEAQRRAAEFVYLGYYVRGSRTMEYKVGYRPCELLRPDGSWERVER